MRATIEWSYESLSEPEKRLFERLSIFVGGCTLAVATAVCATDGGPPADVLDLLASLVSKSLVLPNLDSSPSRYWMLESFREYARDRLVERGEQWTVAHRHALAALESAQWFNRAFEYVHTSRITAQANYEAANWRSALHWALVERGDVVLGQRIAGELGPYFSFFLATTRHTLFFSHAEGRRWIDTALELAGAQTPRAAFAALKYAAARIAGNLREYGAELKASQIVLDRFGELGDALGVARAEVLRGHALIYLGRSAEAKSSLEPALRAARELGERGSFSVACLMRLLALATESDVLAARVLIAQALQIHRSLGHVSSIAYALLDLSECEFMAGNPELALAHAAQSLAAAPDGNMYAKCSALYGTSLYLQALSRYDEALASVREALDIACEHRFQVYVAWSVEHTATIAVLRPGLPAQRRAHVCALAAQIFGFADARLATLGSARLPFVKPRHAALAGVLRDVLGADLVAELMMQGAAMTEEKAVETAFALARETAT
jgi:tetratricopeptide (TPR) repeat protein